MSTPKLVNFPNIGFQEFEKNMSTPKLGNFPHGSKLQSVNTKTNQFFLFLTCTSLRKTCQHQKFEKKNMSTPKLVNIHLFFDSRSLRDTCQHQNQSIFTIFWIPMQLNGPKKAGPNKKFLIRPNPCNCCLQFACMFYLVMPSSTFLTVQIETARGGCEFGHAF